MPTPSLRRTTTRLAYAVIKPRVRKILSCLNEEQWQSHETLVTHQNQQIQRLLAYANTYVPYYRELFAKIGFHPDDARDDPTVFCELPLLTKQVARQNYKRLITAEECRRRSLVRAVTGGTTGEPLRLMQDPAYLDYNTAHIYHKMSWSGWRVGDPQGWLWGHAVVGEGAKPSIGDRAKNRVVQRLESNAFHMTGESLEKFASQLEGKPGCAVWSYASSMMKFARFLDKRGHHIHARAIYTAGEPLFDHQRAFIEEVFGCRVYDNYSCVEIGSIACECPRDEGLHITMRNCYIEVLRDGKPVIDGEDGEFVLTNLTNYGFPLIRYRIEDWGRKSPQPCSCGRGLPLLETVQGRSIDHFKTRDGRMVWGAFINPMVPALGPIKQYQIVQKSLDHLVFRVICDGPIDEDRFHDIQQAVKTVLGEDVNSALEYVDALPSTPMGKHRYMISEVN
jgi:phenylacetate-CoA ligase